VNEALRITVALQGSRVEDHPGFHDAFKQLVSSGVVESYEPMCYLGLGARVGWQRAFGLMIDHVRNTGSNAVLLQHFHSPDIPDPSDFIRSLRQLPERPVIATSCGDPFGGLLRRPPMALRKASSLSDITFSSGMGALADELARIGGRRITLLPLSSCQVRFAPGHEPERLRDPDFDIVFIGSRIASRNPGNTLFWTSRRRRTLIEVLDRRYGKRLAVFGHGWKGLRSWQGSVPYSDQLLTLKRGRIGVGGYPNAMTDYYTSDRPFIIGAAGLPLVDWHVPRSDRIFAAGDGISLATSTRNFVQSIDDLLDRSEDERDLLGDAFATSCRLKHTTMHRVQFMVDVLLLLLDASRAGVVPSLPRLPFFHNEVNQSTEKETASRNW